jgi:hypothetical protein
MRQVVVLPAGVLQLVQVQPLQGEDRPAVQCLQSKEVALHCRHRPLLLPCSPASTSSAPSLSSPQAFQPRRLMRQVVVLPAVVLQLVQVQSLQGEDRPAVQCLQSKEVALHCRHRPLLLPCFPASTSSAPSLSSPQAFQPRRLMRQVVVLPAVVLQLVQVQPLQGEDRQAPRQAPPVGGSRPGRRLFGMAGTASEWPALSNRSRSSASILNGPR